MMHSNANLGVHGQGLLNLLGPGDWIEAQHLVLSLFYSICNDPPRCYGIHTLIFDNFNFFL